MKVHSILLRDSIYLLYLFAILKKNLKTYLFKEAYDIQLV